nr:hypothetical protein [Tanacetum cinerariifolium]
MSLYCRHENIFENVGKEENFKGGSWVSAVEFVNAHGRIVNGCLGDTKNYLKNGKLEHVVAIIKSCTSNDLGGLTVNISQVFPNDTVPKNGSGVDGNEIMLEEEEEEMAELDKEALILALEEKAIEAMAEQEWKRILTLDEDNESIDSTKYRGMISSLLYLTASRTMCNSEGFVNKGEIEESSKKSKRKFKTMKGYEGDEQIMFEFILRGFAESEIWDKMNRKLEDEMIKSNDKGNEKVNDF